MPASVLAGNISLINKNVPLNLYKYDVNNFGGQYYDFTFTFKVADNPTTMGSPNDINANSYFEADINSKRLDLRGTVLKSGLSEAPAEIIANSDNGVMYVTKMNADENKGKTIEKTVRIPMALLFSITKENNVPFHWKIYNANPDFNGNYNEIYASGTIALAEDPAVDVTPKINVAENKSIYKMLAPIGNITCMDSSGKDTNCISNDIGKYLNIIFKLAIGICAALAVIMLIIAGVSYMGDESVFGKTEAKKKMFSAVLGLIIALGAWALLNTINPALTGKEGLVIDTASVEITQTSGGGYYGVTIGTPGNPNANKNITTYDAQLKTAASKYGLSCTLLKSFMYAESGGVNNLTSPSGAQGLIQLMPKTFAEQGVGSDPMDAQTNIMAGASYLSKLQKNGCNLSAKSSVCDISNIQYLAASYNGGPGANKEATACPGSTNWQCTAYAGYQQTRIYAPRVEANFNKLTANGWGC